MVMGRRHPHLRRQEYHDKAHDDWHALCLSQCSRDCISSSPSDKPKQALQVTKSRKAPRRGKQSEALRKTNYSLFGSHPLRLDH